METCELFRRIASGKLQALSQALNFFENIDAPGTYTFNDTEHENVTGLNVAAFHGHKHIVERLIELNADPNSETSLGWCAIHFAAQKGHFRTIMVLHSAGAHVDPLTKNNETPLSLAIQRNARDTVRILLSIGASHETALNAIVWKFAFDAKKLKNGSVGNVLNTTAQGDSSRLALMTNSIFPTDASSIRIDQISGSSLNSDILLCQSTTYDNEIDKFKNELTTKAAATECLKPLRVVLNSDIPIDSRISALNKIKLTLRKNRGSVKINPSVVDSIIRLVEACVCQTSCPTKLVDELTTFVVELISKKTFVSDNQISLSSDDLISYLVRKASMLVIRSNQIYRLGLIRYMTRLVELCDFANSSTSMSKSIVEFVSNVGRLGDALDQPLNVGPLASLLVAMTSRMSPETLQVDIVERVQSIFSDLTDILVGWIVNNKTGQSKQHATNNELIKALSLGFSGWWFQQQPPDVASENICQMLTNLLDDAIDASLSKLPTESASNLGQLSLGPIFNSTRSFLAAFSSILVGLARHRTKQQLSSSFRSDLLLQLSPKDLQRWQSRLLSIALAACESWQQQCHSTTGWTRNRQSSSVANFSYQLVDSIECHVFTSLAVLQPLASSLDLFAYFEKRLSNTDDRLLTMMSGQTLTAMLNLFQVALLGDDHQQSDNTLPPLFNLLFNSGSLLDSLKSWTWHLQDADPPSLQLTHLFIKLSSRYATPVCRMSLNDFRRCLVTSRQTLTSQRHLVSLFSVNLLTSLWSSGAIAKDNKARVVGCMLDVLFANKQEHHWLAINNDHLRIGLLAFFNTALCQSTVAEFSDHILRLASYSNRAVRLSSLEHLLTGKLINLVIESLLDSQSDSSNISTRFLSVILHQADALLASTSCPIEPEVIACQLRLVIRLLPILPDLSPFHRSHLVRLAISASRMTHLPSSSIRSAGCDLWLALDLGHRRFFDPSLVNHHQALLWFTSRRPDQLATSLLLPSRSSVSVSALPSLTIVPACLGILTRGQPRRHVSRLGLLQQHPDAWLRRILAMISPLPVDSPLGRSFNTSCSPSLPILWLTAWTMLDFKLKVAPWVNSHRTLASLENILSVLNAFAHNCGDPAPSSSDSQLALASSSALGQQLWTNQVGLANRVVSFLGLVERQTTAVVLGPAKPLSSTRLFLRLNSATFIHWFTRLRLHLVRLSDRLPSIGPGAATSVVYQVYRIVERIINASHVTSDECRAAFTLFWQAQCSCSDQIMVPLARALYQLRAWEELTCIANWSNQYFPTPKPVDHRPFAWLDALSDLAHGWWDSGVDKLTAYIASFVHASSSKVKLITCEPGFAFALDLLIGLQLDAGNLPAAVEVVNLCHDVICKLAPSNSSGDTGLARSVERSVWSRLSLRLTQLRDLTKLGCWSESEETGSLITNCIDVLNVEDDDISDKPHYWSINRRQLRWSSLLTHDVSSGKHRLLVNLRQLTVKCCDSDDLSLVDSNLQGRRDLDIFDDDSNQLRPWFVRCRAAAASIASTNYPSSSDAVIHSSCCWMASSHPGGDSAELVPTPTRIQACKWALSSIGNSPRLASRLLLGNSTPIDDNTSLLLDHYQRTTNVEHTSISPLVLLSYTDCLSDLLWRRRDARLGAIYALSDGLAKSIADYTTAHSLSHQQQRHAEWCESTSQLACRLFDWLEERSDDDGQAGVRPKWAELVHSRLVNETLQIDDLEQKIAHRLDYFTRLACDQWSSGLPSNNHQPSLLDTASSDSPRNHHTLWVSRLLMLATHLSPSGYSPPAWLKMANWCYARGSDMIIQSHDSAARLLAGLDDKAVVDKPFLDSANQLIDLLHTDEYNDFISDVSPSLFDASATDSDGEASSTVAGLLAALLTFRCSTKSASSKADDLSPDQVGFGQLCLLIPAGRLCPDDDSEDQGQRFKELESHLRVKLGNRLDLTRQLSPELLGKLSSTAALLSQRCFTLQSSAAQAYATYLTIAGHSPSTGISPPPLPRGTSKLDTTTATLKLLDMLSLPSRQLRSLVGSFLVYGVPSLDANSMSPTTLGGPSIWQACLDQLLTRLSLPDPETRQALLGLLQHLILSTSNKTTGSSRHDDYADNNRFAAHLVYPSVVALIDSRRLLARVDKPAPADSALAIAQQPDVFVKDTPTGQCFTQLANTLCQAGYISLVGDVETFVGEMQRITLLWDELWLGALQQHAKKFISKMSSLDAEVKQQHTKWTVIKARIQSNADRDAGEQDRHRIVCQLLRVKFAASVQSTIDLLDRLCELTFNAPAETPHEVWFQSTYLKPVERFKSSLIIQTKRPINCTTPVLRLRDLIKLLRYQTTTSRLDRRDKRSLPPQQSDLLMQRRISLANISPRLARMQFGRRRQSSSSSRLLATVPLPGQCSLVQATSIADQIDVLPSKTRPKRLLLRASNGRHYPYLVKGLEDLRLDDRVMRLFDLVGLAYHQHSSSSSHNDMTDHQLRLRTYAVTPIGLRAGLIQMVQGCPSLFSIYKRWQAASASNDLDDSSPSTLNHEQALLSIDEGGGDNIFRPVRLFQQRVKEVVADSPLSTAFNPTTLPRSNWPPELLKSVFTSLEREVPSDLLSREFWAANLSSASWWRVSRTYARSTGVTSILGYLVGLGDRHLANLLVDLTTGHVIHIDFNVCFDKGRSLVVPERVPFRLTRVMRHALGPIASLPSSSSPTDSTNTSVQGPIRVSAEQALTLVRSLSDPILIQLKAFIIDPLVNWHQSDSHQIPILTDSYLSTYRGGGCSTGQLHRQTSQHIQSMRIGALVRQHSASLLTFLGSAFNQSGDEPRLESVNRYLDEAIDILGRCSDLAQLQSGHVQLRKRQKAVCKATSSQLIKSECRCIASEQAFCRLADTMQSIASSLGGWREQQQTISYQIHFTAILQGKLESTSSELLDQLGRYQSIASFYIPNALAILASQLNRFEEALSNVCSFSLSSTALEQCKRDLVQLQTNHYNDHAVDLANNLSSLLTTACQTLTQLEQQQTLGDALSPDLVAGELDKINQAILLPYPGYGLTAYSLALLNQCIEAALSSSRFEIVTDDATVDANVPDELHICIDNLLVGCKLIDPPIYGLFPPLPGIESNIGSEIMFALNVRDVLKCLLQLRRNLTRVILPELVDVFLTCDPQRTSDFVDRLLQLVDDCNNNLGQRVSDFLSSSSTSSDSDTIELRLHQLLLSIHLTLSNAEAELVDLAVVIGQLVPAMPQSWYFVDLLFQPLTVLCSRSNCPKSSGAADLWGFVGGDSSATSSWTDELYTAGLLTFLGLLDKLRLHVGAINERETADQQQLISMSLAPTLTSFITCLVKRLALPSLTSLACGRMACALAECHFRPIGHLVADTEMALQHQQSVQQQQLIVNLSVYLTSQSLTDFYAIQYAFDASGLLALRDTALQFLQQLSSLVGSIHRRLSLEDQIDACRRQVNFAQRSLKLTAWIRHYDSIAELDQPIDSFLTQLESSLEKDQADESSDVVGMAKAVLWFERLRINGLPSLPIYQQSLQLIDDLQTALVERDQTASDLTEFDSHLLTIKSQYKLDWPASSWLSSHPVADSAPNRTLRSLLDHEVKVSDQRVKKSSQHLIQLLRSRLFAPSHHGAPSLHAAEQLRLAIGWLIRSCLSSSDLRLCLDQLDRLMLMWPSQWLKDRDQWVQSAADLVRGLASWTRAIAPLVTTSGDDDLPPQGELLTDACKLLELARQLKADLHNRVLEPLICNACAELLESSTTTTYSGQDMDSLLTASLPSVIDGLLPDLCRLTGIDKETVACYRHRTQVPLCQDQHDTVDQRASPSAYNSKAVDMLLRIRQRLTGCDPLLWPKQQPDKRHSVKQQIDACFEAATSQDNLAFMYEGWAAWV